jgi:predicted nucleotidyltransferase
VGRADDVVVVPPPGRGSVADMTSHDHVPREPLHSAIARAFERSPVPVAAVYLFGSHAEGRAHRESDVDVGVLLRHADAPTAQARFDARVRLIGWLIGELHQNDVDVVILNDAPPLLGRRIVTSGTRIVCFDSPADHAFVRDVQLRAADLEPFLRRARRVKLAALAR